MRSLAREIVFKELFAKLFNPDDEEFFAVFHTFLLKFDNLELYTYIVTFFSQNFH